jgi:hypothetical protein
MMVSARYGDGGKLVFSVVDTPHATLTIDETGLFHPVDNPSAVRVSGTATCNMEVFAVGRRLVHSGSVQLSRFQER